MKYFDLYLAGLYDALQAGGAQDVVDRTIAEVNNPTATGLETYLKDHPLLPCGVCGVPFPEDDHVPTLDEEVLCPDCRKTTSPS